MPRALIFANGELPDLHAARRLLADGDLLIAADGGLRHLNQMDRLPDILVGDMDSVPAADLARLTLAGVRVLRFSPQKDETDLELALQAALSAKCDPIVVVGALGGRMDQTLGNIALLTNLALRGRLSLDDGIQQVFAITKELNLTGRPGEIVSLIPWGAEVSGVVTHGLRYPLKDETLLPDHARGLSNELLDSAASIQIRSGILLCFHARKI
jgi:thiamine pyrophosphokinase